jgi:Thymidylate synthase
MTGHIVPFNYLSGRDTFNRIGRHTWNLFLSHAHKVHTERWQGVDISKRPEMTSYELMNYTFTHDLGGIEDLDHWRKDISPNLPWADRHFEERVCGFPINPGVEWANWPWGDNAANFLDEKGMFNHNYMERYWPKHAHAGSLSSLTGEQWLSNEEGEADGEPLFKNYGIRNEYGDLNDLVQSLAKNPLSRQEWFPIFHPEDVGEVVGGRKPCSLGYQFWVRGGRLHIYYPLRSCDFFRHMQDDIYLTVRLLLWVLDKCRAIDPSWQDVVPGTFTMHCTSLHVFANDMISMTKEGPK